MDLKNLVSRQRNKILNIAVIVLALIIANNIYKAQVKSVRLLEQRRDLEIKKNKILGEISQSENRVSSFKKMVNRKDISLIPNELNNIARASSVKIVSLKPRDQKDYLAYTRYPFDLVVVSSNYHYIGKFISKMENSPDIYKVEGIKVRKATEQEKKDKKDKLTAELRLSTFLIKD